MLCVPQRHFEATPSADRRAFWVARCWAPLPLGQRDPSRRYVAADGSGDWLRHANLDGLAFQSR